MITLILSFVCILYGVGSVETLSLEDFWCQKHTWDEVASHNRGLNNTYGVGECYRSSRVYFDTEKLYETDVNKNALIVASDTRPGSIIKSILFFIVVLVLLFLFLKYLFICCNDCNKTIKDEW